MKLYELTSNYQQVLEIAEQLDAETLTDTLDAIEDAIEDKAENTAKIIKQLDADAEMLRNEEKRLATRRQAIENNAKNLKRYLQESLEKVGMEKVKGDLFTVAIQNNPPSLEVLDELKIDIDYFNYPEPVLDKKAVLQTLKRGIKMEGARIKQTRSLRIR